MSETTIYTHLAPREGSRYEQYFFNGSHPPDRGDSERQTRINAKCSRLHDAARVGSGFGWRPSWYIRHELSPHEPVIWSGQPRSRKRITLQSASKALMGLVLIVFTLFWMGMGIRGGNNNWDKGRGVAPFATHNVLIAALAGLWMIPPGLYLLFSPLRSWRRLKRTYYALTDRRALIVAPDFLGRNKTKSFTTNELRLMRVEDHDDDNGDLIFACLSTWFGLAETVGFLGIDKARDVDALVRKTLVCVSQPATNSSPLSTAKTMPAATVRKRYQLSLWIRLFQYVWLAAGVLLALCIIADVILIYVVLVLGPERLLGPPSPHLKPFSGVEIAAMIAAGVSSLLMSAVVSGMFLHFALRIPIEITINENQEVNFRGRLRTVTIPVSDLVMIRTGRWFDPNRFRLDVVHKRGKLTLINHFSDFTDFLATVKDLNPAIEIKGF